MTKQLVQGRAKYEEAVKGLDPEDQEFYRQVEATDMFSAFYQSQRWAIGSGLKDHNLGSKVKGQVGSKVSVMPVSPLTICRQGTQSDFNLLAIRVEREERRQNNSGDLEESVIRPRASLLYTSSIGGRRMSGVR